MILTSPVSKSKKPMKNSRTHDESLSIELILPVDTTPNVPSSFFPNVKPKETLESEMADDSSDDSSRISMTLIAAALYE